MPVPRRAPSSQSGAAGRKSRPHALLSLVARLLTAQAAAGAAIGLAYSRRNLPWLVLTLVIAVLLCGLAALVRSGSHTTWLAAISVESVLVATGLFRFAYARYPGGTLLAIIGLGTLLRPSVARAFAVAPRWYRPAADPALAEGGPDALREPAAG